MRSGVAAAIAVLLAGACAAGLAGAAAKPRFDSTVSLRVTAEGEDAVFRGRVRSQKPACQRNRKVEVTAGNHGPGAEPHSEGITRTNGEGRYELRVPLLTNSIGDYRATALRKAKPRFVCKRARSPVVNP